MRQVDWEDAVLEYEPLAKWRTLRQWACYKYDINSGTLEILLELHKLKEFTTEDFGTAVLTASWSSRDFYKLRNDGWIETYRKREGKFKKYNLYNLTRKSKSMIRKIYNILSGKEQFPDEAWDGKWSYKKDRLKKKINKDKNK